MATLEQMQAAINKLVSDEPIPGLDFDTVVENIVGQKYKETLAQIEDVQEREKQFKNMVNYYKTEARAEIEGKINDVKAAYKSVKAQIKSIKASIVAATAGNAIPSVIIAGAGVAAPNPLYSLAENANKKSMLLGMLEVIAKTLYDMLKAALAIMFEIPDAVVELINTIAEIKSLIQSIPTP